MFPLINLTFVILSCYFYADKKKKFKKILENLIYFDQVIL